MPEAAKVKVGLVGLGAAARQIHLPALSTIPGARVVGGVDTQARPEPFSFPLFPSVEEMVQRTGADVVVVATPPDTHFALTRAALLAGAHVMCEKPFVATLEEASTLAALARECKRRVVVNNQYRFMRIHEAARAAVGTPEFGRLLFLSAEQTFRVTAETEAGWRGQETDRTCREFGTHVLDLCRFFFAEDPLAVTARMPRGPQGGGPDYLNLIQLEFSGDRVAQITLDRLSRGPHRYLRLRLDGESGCVETRIGGGVELAAGIRGGTRRPFVRFDLALGGRARLYGSGRPRTIATDPFDVFATATGRLYQAFFLALKDGTTPPCDADDNRRTLALMLAAYESHRQRRTIPMEY